MSAADRMTVARVGVNPPEGTSAEVAALAAMIAARASGRPRTADEWRAIVRAAERIARIGRRVVG